MTEKKARKEGFAHLLSPIEIKGVEIRNRIALAPMNTLMSLDNRGYVNEQILAYYAARAKGGCGLIITECVLGTRLASRFPYTSNLHLYDLSHFPGLAELAETIHAFGSVAFIQMSIGFGRQGHSHTGERPPAPSVVPMMVSPEYLPRGFGKVLEKYPQAAERALGAMPYEMTVDEIRREQDEFANSCRFAMGAQFDGIELHAPHGYLEHQFLSPLTNKRTDLYGGSLQNRMRFLVETYLKVREAVGFDYILGVRLSADEHLPGGFTHEEALEVGRTLAGLGADYIHLSDGSYEALKYFFPDEDGTMLEEAANFKKATNLPVICPSIHDPYLAEEAIAKGKCDIVSLGRQMFADPEWGNKVAEGRVEEIRRCKRCNECLMRTVVGLPVRCIQNPNTGREKYMPEYWRPPVKSKPVTKMRVPPRLPELRSFD
ncbi:MAG: NADH:flavin oxidoreductase [Syntrophomonadaceae bacterium]|nr:NADH:flavin oxidoreductase [Syntrophomonadaceae bacterium]